MAPDLAKDGASVDVREAVPGLLAGVEARYCFGPSWRVLLVHGVGVLSASVGRFFLQPLHGAALFAELGQVVQGFQPI